MSMGKSCLMKGGGDYQFLRLESGIFERVRNLNFK